METVKSEAQTAVLGSKCPESENPRSVCSLRTPLRQAPRSQASMSHCPALTTASSQTTVILPSRRGMHGECHDSVADHAEETSSESLKLRMHLHAAFASAC